MNDKYKHWHNIDFDTGWGDSKAAYTLEELYQMFAQRLACEAAERTLDMLKAGL
jgi:hypothetical protein